MPRTEQVGLNTGSVTSLSTCGSSAFDWKTRRFPLGPLACTLYCQKKRSLPLLLLNWFGVDVRVSSSSPEPPELSKKQVRYYLLHDQDDLTLTIVTAEVVIVVTVIAGRIIIIVLRKIDAIRR